MNLEPNEFQAEIADTASSFLADRLPLSRVRALALMDGPAIGDAEWAACAEMGWLALMLPEDKGGIGLGMAEAVMIFREIGRHLTPGPLRSTALAALVAAEAGDLDLAGALAAGTRRAGLAYGEYALDAAPGDLLLAIDDSGAKLIEVTGVTPVKCVDPTARLGRPALGATVAQADDPRLITRLRLLIAAELLGVVEAVRDMSAEYAKVREQFGQPIGTFQAVKHRCAEMAIRSYALRSQLFLAAVRFDANLDDAAFQAASAHVLAMEAARRGAADNIQNHGGIGVTFEQDAHLYVKRALLLDYATPRRASHAAVLAPERHEFA